MNTNSNQHAAQEVVPSFSGRLYSDELIDQPNGVFGNWVRRMEVDSLLDKNKALQAQVDALNATLDALARVLTPSAPEGVRPSFKIEEAARVLACHAFLHSFDFREDPYLDEKQIFDGGWDARVRFQRSTEKTDEQTTDAPALAIAFRNEAYQQYYQEAKISGYFPGGTLGFGAGWDAHARFERSKP